MTNKSIASKAVRVHQTLSERFPVKVKEIEEGSSVLPTGCSLYWRTNDQGAREYYSDECGIPVVIWDTTTIHFSSLLAAIVKEEEHRIFERRLKEEKERSDAKM